MINSAPHFVYKILTTSQWEAIQQNGFTSEFASELDKRDGYIHLSQSHQVAPIAQKYFSNMTDGVLLKIDFAKIQPLVKWEPNSKGEDFPHVYGELPKEAIIHQHTPFNTQTFNFESLMEANQKNSSYGLKP